MARSQMAARSRVSQWITLLCIGTLLLSMQHHKSYFLLASAQQVTVTPTTLRCTTNGGGGGCTDMVVEKSISLLNGAVDYKGILTINTTHVVTIIASGVSPLSIAAGVSPTSYTTMIFVEAINISLRNASSSSSASTVTNVQGVTPGVVVPTATFTTSSIPPFLDEVGNPWTLPPLPTTATTTASTSSRTMTITFNKANTKVRFTMQRALVKSYYPVSEYMFQVPSDATLCTSGTSAAAAAGYKCCLISASSSATGSAYYEVYSLSSAVEPTTCTVNASIVYLDHYHTMEVGYVWWGTRGATVYRGGVWYQGSIILVVKGDVRNVLAEVNSSVYGSIGVSRSAVSLAFLTTIPDQQLCRKGGYLTNTAQAEPFLVNNWGFGYSTRQIGYNITQYVIDRQCNGAPLGYYTSNDGNNSDQFSTWRTRTTTNLLAPLTWRNDVATISTVNSGLTVYYGDYFSMSSSTGPATSAVLQFSPPSSQGPALRPSFVTVVPLTSGVSIPTRINTSFISISHFLQLASNPLYSTSSGASLTPTTTLFIGAACSVMTPTSSIVQSVSWTTTVATSFSSFPIVIGWTFASPMASLLSTPTSITCTYTIARTDISASTITTSTTPQSISTLVTSMSDEVASNIILPVIIAANISHMALYAAQHISPLPTSYFTVSTISAQQCPLDDYYSLWVGVCDLMTDALCSRRYPPQVGGATTLTTGRPLMDSTLSKCVPNSTSLTSLGTTESSLLAAKQQIFQTLYQSLVWRNGADSGGPTGIIDGLVSIFTSTPTPTTTAPSPTPTTTTTTQLHITVPSWQFNGTLFVSLIDGSVTSTRPSASVVPNESLVMIIFTRNTSTPTTGGGSGTGSDWWVTSVAIAVSKMPFTGKAVAGLVLLVLAALSLLLILFVWVRLRAWLPWGEDAAAVWGWVQEKRPTWNGIKQKATVVHDMFHAVLDRWKAFRQARREERKAQRKSERRRRRSANADGNECAVDVNNNNAADGGREGAPSSSSAHVGRRVLTWLRSLGGRREPPLPSRRSSRKPSTSSSSRASRSSTAERRRQRDSVTERNAPRQRTRREESPDLVDSGGEGAGAEMQQHQSLSSSSHQPDSNNIPASHHRRSEALESSTRLLKYTHSNRYQQQQQRNTEPPPPPTTGQNTQLLRPSSVDNLHHYHHRDDAYEDRRHTLSPPDGIDEDLFHPRQDDRYGQHRNNVIASAPPAASPQIADSVVEYHEPFENVVQQQQHQQLPRRQHLTSSSHHAESSREVQPFSQCYDFHRAAAQHASELSARNNSSRLNRQSSSRRSSTNPSVALMTVVDELPPRSPSTRSHHMPLMYSTPPRDESRQQRRLAAAAVVRHLDYKHSSSSFGVEAPAVAAPRGQEERADADVNVTTSQRPASTPRQGELLHTRSLSTHQDEQQRGAQQHKHKEDSRRQVHSRVHPDPHHQRNYVGGSHYSLLSTINVVPPSLSGDEAASSPSPRKKQHDAPRSAPQLYNEVENPRSMPSAVYVQSPERSHVRRHRRQTASAEMPAPPASIVRQALEAEEVAEQPPPLPRTAATSVATSTHHRPHTSSSSTKQRLGAESHSAEEGRRNNRPSSPASQVVQSTPPEGGKIQDQSQREPSPAEVVQRFLAATSLRDKTPSSHRGSDDEDESEEPARRRHHQGQGPQPYQTSLQAPPRLHNEHSRRVDPPAPPLTLDGGSDVAHNRPRRCG